MALWAPGLADARGRPPMPALERLRAAARDHLALAVAVEVTDLAGGAEVVACSKRPVRRLQPGHVTRERTRKVHGPEVGEIDDLIGVQVRTAADDVHGASVALEDHVDRLSTWSAPTTMSAMPSPSTSPVRIQMPRRSPDAAPMNVVAVSAAGIAPSSTWRRLRLVAQLGSADHDGERAGAGTSHLRGRGSGDRSGDRRRRLRSRRRSRPRPPPTSPACAPAILSRSALKPAVVRVPPKVPSPNTTRISPAPTRPSGSACTEAKAVSSKPSSSRSPPPATGTPRRPTRRCRSRAGSIRRCG